MEIAIVPNYGSDIAPLLIAHSPKFGDHDICLKIHSKRSSHSSFGFGERWRTYLYHEVMGSADRVSSIVNAMIAHPDLGVLMPHPWPEIRQWYGIGPNLHTMQRVLTKVGVHLLPGQEIEYPAGSMFWFRSEALCGLRDFGFGWLDFGHAAEEQDGALQHGMERCFLFFCVHAKKKWAFLPPA
jgi:lipopolysaccharide biosynthesis protein